MTSDVAAPIVYAMTLPALTNADVTNLETFAAALQKKTAYGGIPSKLAVNGIGVPIRAVMPQEASTQAMGDEDLRALYSPMCNEIQVYCFGVEIAKSSRALDHIVCVLGHEALHAIQNPHFSKDQIEEASQLSKEATKSPEAYGAYISCVVELPAHAVMIALELRQNDPPDFDEAASNTHIYRYFATKLNNASMMSEVLQQLVATAREMHRNLRHPNQSSRGEASAEETIAPV